MKQAGILVDIVYSFSTPYGGDLIYYPQKRTATSPFLPEGVLVQLSPLEGLLLETFMRDSTAVHTPAKLISLMRENLSQALVPNESNRVGVTIHRLREKLGDTALNNKGRFSTFRLIHTTPMGYTLVPNPLKPKQVK